MNIEIRAKLINCDNYKIQMKFNSVINNLIYFHSILNKRIDIIVINNKIQVRYFINRFLSNDVRNIKIGKWFTILKSDENSVDYQTKDIEEIINEIMTDLNNNQTEETIFLINKFKRPELKNLITIPYSYNKFCEYVNKRSNVIGILTKNIRIRGKHLDKNYINEILFTKFKLKYFYKTISIKTYNYYMYEDKMTNSIRLLDTKYIGE